MEQNQTHTAFMRHSDARNEAIYREYHKLIKIPGAKKTTVIDNLMHKHKIFTRTTIYKILKRVEQHKQTPKT